MVSAKGMCLLFLLWFSGQNVPFVAKMNAATTGQLSSQKKTDSLATGSHDHHPSDKVATQHRFFFFLLWFTIMLSNFTFTVEAQQELEQQKANKEEC